MPRISSSASAGPSRSPVSSCIRTLELQRKLHATALQGRERHADLNSSESLPAPFLLALPATSRLSDRGHGSFDDFLCMRHERISRMFTVCSHSDRQESSFAQNACRRLFLLLVRRLLRLVVGAFVGLRLVRWRGAEEPDSAELSPARGRGRLGRVSLRVSLQRGSGASAAGGV